LRKIDVFFDEIQVLIGQTECEVLRKELVLFFEKHKNGFSRVVDGKHIAFCFLIINLKNVNIKEINWGICVGLHNLVMYEKLMINKKVLPSSLKTKVIKYYRDYKEKGLSNGLFSYQMYINDLYHELYKHLKHEYVNILNIKYFEKYLAFNYYQYDKRFFDYKNEELFSALINFPQDEDYTKLTKIPMKNGSRNYWLNTKSVFIRTWVENYLSMYALKYLEPVLFRLVGYFFVDSVNNYKWQVESYQKVDNDFFNHQIEYFKEISGEIIQRTSPGKPNAFIN